ncbi:M23 family metallopeptidase [Vibrio sp. S4M6]|uniref:M23 family metallopeptidase n=1 Tax=Vibrio sinus TaxID=2946865 RepID=UPI00202AA545|nr:M23 family metallopeptidase [Vibrio sinus]MCL9780714.1 M23 family metallopeptidase [Vibrio sinus]
MKILITPFALLWSIQGLSHSLVSVSDTSRIDIDTLSQQNITTSIPEDNFVYQPIRNPFIMADYFSDYPTWLALEESLQHWSGAMGIDPRVLLTTLAINHDWSPEDPATEASIQYYTEELKLVASHLSQYYYHIKEQSFSSDNAATYAIMVELNQPDLWPTWLDVYHRWFGEPKMVERDSQSSPPNMQWPWRIGYRWVPNGPHSHTGSGFPLSSVDVSYDWPRWGGETYSVTAAHEGYVSVFSRCQLRVTHPDGWATNYYHMDGIEVQNRAWVEKNDRLGTYATQRNEALCQGGSSTGPHLHFSLLLDGRFQSLQNVWFGPYRVDVGRYSYDSSCQYSWMFDNRTNIKRCFWYRVDNPES